MITEYKTLSGEVQGEVTVKKSKFISYIKPIENEDELNEYVQMLKKKHYDARHHCVAAIYGIDYKIEKSSDDGEPQGTAGKPMLEVLRGEELVNVVAVVVRYFGGTLLGTGGLVKAYTKSVQSALENTGIEHYKLCQEMVVKVDYTLLAKVEYVLRSQKILIETIHYNEFPELVVLPTFEKKEHVYDLLIETTSDRCEIKMNDLRYILM